MKQEILESYITYIFDFFQKSRCFKAGQGNMLRNFRFAAEKQFTRNQLGILYFLVNTLIDNGYLYLKDRDFIALTENGTMFGHYEDIFAFKHSGCRKGIGNSDWHTMLLGD